MAAPACTQCGENPAFMLLNNLETGDSDAICGACLPGFIATLAEAILSAAVVPPDDLVPPDHADSPLRPVAATTEPSATDETEPAPDPKANGRSRARSLSPPTADDNEAAGETIAEPTPTAVE